jgi:hypothetical protein
MTRHLIIGRYGPGDRVACPAAADEQATPIDLIASQKQFAYGIGHALDDLRKLGVVPTEIGLDLLVLAALVYAADTRISRKTQSEDAWTREIRLVVPVSDPARWNATIIVLQRMLNFLTGDIWLVGFRARPPRFANAITAPKNLIDPPFDEVSLFSGGLDSLIGAIDLLEAGRTPLFVSHSGEGAVSKAQSDCFDPLTTHYRGRQFARFRLWMNFPKKLVEGVASDDTTRGRSFLFFAAAAFAGSGLRRAFGLRASENGLIAVNVPLDVLRLGANSTRTTHPFYMARWNELLQMLGIPGRIHNPYWDKTKGEMVAACANPQLLRGLVPQSLSCASPTKGRWQGKKGHGSEHCGYCLPCLIRRAALIGINDPTTYAVPNLRAKVWSSTRATGEQIRSFQFAIERLRKRPDLARLLIHKPGPLSDNPGDNDALADVYRRGMDEVGALLTGVRTRPS